MIMIERLKDAAICILTLIVFISGITFFGAFVCFIGFALGDFVSSTHVTTLHDCMFYGFFVGLFVWSVVHIGSAIEGMYDDDDQENFEAQIAKDYDNDDIYEDDDDDTYETDKVVFEPRKKK